MNQMACQTFCLQIVKFPEQRDALPSQLQLNEQAFWISRLFGLGLLQLSRDMTHMLGPQPLHAQIRTIAVYVSTREAIQQTRHLPSM